MSEPEITAADLRSSTWKTAFHARLGRGGFILTRRNEKFPRLFVTQQRETGREPLKRSVQVDGVECLTVADVLKRLNAPPAPAAEPGT